MSKINIERIVRDIKTRSTSLTPIIEAVCNSIEAIGKSIPEGKITDENRESFDTY